MQLMPSLLSTTGKIQTVIIRYELETILIYSCENSCKDSYETRCCYLWPDEELMFNKRANATKPK